MARTLLFYLVITLNCLTVQAATFFVSNNGDDSRSFLEAQNPLSPWKTIDKVNRILSSLKPGDKVFFRNGEVFQGQLNIDVSGEEGQSIVFGTYGEGVQAVISGTFTLSNWEKLSEDLYEAKMREMVKDPNLLLFEGLFHPKARYPRSDQERSGYLNVDGFSESHILSNNLNMIGIDYPTEIVIRKNNWVIDRYPVSKFEKNKIIFNQPEKAAVSQEGFGFFLQNHPAFLFESGDWYFDSDQNKVVICHKGDISQISIEIGVVDTLIHLGPSSKYIEFQGLNFKGANKDIISINGASHIIFDKCKFEHAGRNAFNTINSTGLTVKNCSITNSLNSGVNLGWEDQEVVISENEFLDTFNYQGHGQNSEIQGNVIYMSETSDNIVIEKNKFLNSGYNAIYFHGNNIEIKNNFIDTFCFVKDDGAGIYTFAGFADLDYKNRKIEGNFIVNGIGARDGTKPFNKKDPPYVEGVYLDRNSDNVSILGNTILNIRNKGVFVNNSSNIEIHGNKIFNTGISIFVKNDEQSKPMSDLNISRNQMLIFGTDKHFFRWDVKDVISEKSIVIDDNHYINGTINEKLFVKNRMLGEKRVGHKDWVNLMGFDSRSLFCQISVKPYLDIQNQKFDLNKVFLYHYNFSDSLLVLNLDSDKVVDTFGNKLNKKINLPAYSSILLIADEESINCK